MRKLIVLSVLSVAGLLVMAGTADAAWRPFGWFGHYCPTPAVVTPAQAVTPPQTPTGTQTVRSYSYEPAAPAYQPYVSSYRSGWSDPGNNFDAGRKIKGM